MDDDDDNNSLMTKFSKKLVSKCIYVQILKITQTELLGMFMGAGGWNLTHVWLSDAIMAKNWPLIQELLELLLICPVDVERLKTNSCPKLIKGLSRESANESVRVLACKLVERWLRIVKGESANISAPVEVPQSTECAEQNTVVEPEPQEPIPEEPSEEVEAAKSVLEEEEEEVVLVKAEDPVTSEESGEDAVVAEAPAEQLPVYKITFRDGKQVIAKVNIADKVVKKPVADSEPETSPVEAQDHDKTESVVSESETPVTKPSDSPREVEEETITPKSKSSAVSVKSSPVVKSRKVSKSDSVSSDDGSTRSSKSSKRRSSKELPSPPKPDKKSKVKESLRLKQSAKEKNKDKFKVLRELSKDKNKEKAKEKEKLKRPSLDSANKPNHDTSFMNEKERASLAKLIPASISKLGKIPKKVRPPEETIKKSEDPPKKQEEERREKRLPVPPPPKEPKKQASISIEVRRPDVGRPKTVKVFKSKMRSTGLEEEVKPPPSRAALKKVPPPLLPPLVKPTSSLKRASPVRDTTYTPPEKKLKAAEINPEDVRKEKVGGVKLIPARPKRTTAACRAPFDPRACLSDIYFNLTNLVCSHIVLLPATSVVLVQAMLHEFDSETHKHVWMVGITSQDCCAAAFKRTLPLPGFWKMLICAHHDESNELREREIIRFVGRMVIKGSNLAKGREPLIQSEQL
uniref:TFIIS N-terminal domain-containing protein n=1 Tax=Timema monikensis TaxID=170555 RepID=A0A7R9HLE3_9NEOP|nr:unnamed protein product [Timema monikensis]